MGILRGMIVAGIDEAGYGPVLGPLVVACAAVRTPGDHLADPPDLWKTLSRHCSRKKLSSGRKLHINDSKAVYSPASGVKELERSVLCFLLASPGLWPLPTDRAATLDDLLVAVAPDVLNDLERYPWYRPTEEEPFPLSNDLLSLRLFSNAFAKELAAGQTQLTAWRGRVVLEEPLNRMLEATRNKSNASFSIVAWHIDQLMRRYAAEGLMIHCDRQGGRCHYGSLLRTMFEDWSLEILEETESLCRYRLLRGQVIVPITFAEKAEGKSMAVALASMLAKYLREVLMHRYNRWWRLQVPGLEPTAGYYTDGHRFLRAIESRRGELRIPDHQLIRSR